MKDADGHPEIHHALALYASDMAEYWQQVTTYHQMKTRDPLCEIEQPQKTALVLEFEQHLTVKHP